jgi:hypothetical protein
VFLKNNLIKQGNWDQNWNFCCSLGMEPIIIESRDEQNCLSNLTTSVNWQNNFNYWTAGTQRGCSGQWHWCGSSDKAELKTELQWERFQPDDKGGNESCLHMRVFTTGRDLGVKLTDRNCADRYVLACQVCLFNAIL